jgi:hypothetical protein
MLFLKLLDLLGRVDLPLHFGDKSDQKTGPGLDEFRTFLQIYLSYLSKVTIEEVRGHLQTLCRREFSLD